MLNDKGLHIMM